MNGVVFSSSHTSATISFTHKWEQTAIGSMINKENVVALIESQSEPPKTKEMLAFWPFPSCTLPPPLSTNDDLPPLDTQLWEGARECSTRVGVVVGSGVDLEHEQLHHQIVAHRHFGLTPPSSLVSSMGTPTTAAALATHATSLLARSNSIVVGQVSPINDDYPSIRVLEALRWCILEQNVHILVLLLSAKSEEHDLIDAWLQAAAVEMDVVVVRPLMKTEYPTSPAILTVAPVEQTQGYWDIASPGLNIGGARALGRDSLHSVMLSGVGPATAVTASIALHLKAMFPHWSASQIVEKIRGTARHGALHIKAACSGSFSPIPPMIDEDAVILLTVDCVRAFKWTGDSRSSLPCSRGEGEWQPMNGLCMLYVYEHDARPLLALRSRVSNQICLHHALDSAWGVWLVGGDSSFVGYACMDSEGVVGIVALHLPDTTDARALLNQLDKNVNEESINCAPIPHSVPPTTSVTPSEHPLLHSFPGVRLFGGWMFEGDDGDLPVVGVLNVYRSSVGLNVVFREWGSRSLRLLHNVISLPMSPSQEDCDKRRVSYDCLDLSAPHRPPCWNSVCVHFREVEQAELFVELLKKGSPATLDVTLSFLASRLLIEAGRDVLSCRWRQGCVEEEVCGVLTCDGHIVAPGLGKSSTPEEFASAVMGRVDGDAWNMVVCNGVPLDTLRTMALQREHVE